MLKKRGTVVIIRRLGILGLSAAVLLAALVGCGYADESGGVASYEQAAEKEIAYDVESAPQSANYSSSDSADEDWQATVDEFQPQERLIIRNADLSIIVDDAEESLAAIEGLVDAAGGWVVNSNIWQYDEVKRGNVTVRVPADQLDAFLDEIGTLANEVTNQSISGQDVTEEFVDLQAQLANLQATADRVRAFLEDARNVEEALAVNVELSRLEGEIERISGRMKYLEGSARHSSVSIEITPDALNQPVTIGRWQPEGTAKTAIEALISALQWLIDALIVIVLFVLPLLLVIVGPVYLFIRFLLKRRAKRKSRTQESETEISQPEK